MYLYLCKTWHAKYYKFNKLYIYPYEIDGHIKEKLLHEEYKLVEIFKNEAEYIVNFVSLQHDNVAKSYLPDGLFNEKRNIFVHRYVYSLINTHVGARQGV